MDVQDAEWIREGGEEATQEEEEEESIPDDFYCPLCDKSFKSQKALANHERSVVMPDGQSPPLLPKSMVGKSMLQTPCTCLHSPCELTSSCTWGEHLMMPCWFA